MASSSGTGRGGIRNQYRLDRFGNVLSKAEFNRFLPSMRCAVCRAWIDAAEVHTLADCAKRVKVDA